MEPIKYIAEETNRILEYKEKKWYYYSLRNPQAEPKLIFYAAFYEAGKNERLDKLKAGKIEIREFLDKGRVHQNPFNVPAYIFVPLKKSGKIIIKKTKELTRITDEP